ncbi:MAG: YcjX family protein [Gammaproteobacteria bacterium]
MARIRLGVTGFARAGKTVFIGALAQALLNSGHWHARRGQGPLQGLSVLEQGRLQSVRILDDDEVHVPQFPYRRVRDALLDDSSHWPEPTTGISKLVIELKFRPRPGLRRWLSDKAGLLHSAGNRVVLEIVDYPGEWLLDLPLLNTDYESWSMAMVDRVCAPARAPHAVEYLEFAKSLSPQQPFDVETADQLATLWARHLASAAAAGLVFNQPARLLRPDNLQGAPMLRFAPLPDCVARPDSGSLQAGLRERYEQYKQKAIKPFYRDHFARMDRQIVLLDVLQTLEQGRDVFNETVTALEDTLKSFRYGRGSLLAWLSGQRTSKVLFAATKADHVTRGDRANLVNLVRGMLTAVDEGNRMRAQMRDYEVMDLAAIRATEDWLTEQPPQREILQGRPAGEVETALWDPGALPLDMPPRWDRFSFKYWRFEPPAYPDARLQGFPAINLGRALEFLLGEVLQ